MTVGLAAELGGGAGMYKPSVVPQPPAVLPVAREEPAPSVTPESPEQEVLVERSRQTRTQAQTSQRADSQSQPATPPVGAIPVAPEPGSGGAGSAASGSGGGLGGGAGVSIGPGLGERGLVDSWYVRQVEQRVGANWLRTSLGRISRSVRAVVSFEVALGGAIENVRFERRSGVPSVDLAAERAVRASSPLPPLPHELRRNRVRFVAYFDYPPQ
jgi:TonB family protein